MFRLEKGLSLLRSKGKYSFRNMSQVKPKVLVTRQDIPQVALDKLKQECDVEVYPENFPIPHNILIEKIKGKNGLFCLITEKINKEVLDAAGDSLKVISTMSVGYDHLSMDEIKARKIKVGYTPGVLTDATAELTVALLLATSRRLFEAHEELLNGGWSKCAWSPLWMTGWGLSGSTVGVFGLGRIGQGVVQRLKGFNVRRFIYNSHSKKKEGDDLSAEFVSFKELLKQSDFLVITSSLTEETKGIFNKEAFAKMKSNAILINTARGGMYPDFVDTVKLFCSKGIIDQDALIEALKSGKIQAAGLDAMTPEPLPTDHPLIKTPNITLIPHIGSAEKKTREEMALLTANNIIAGLKGDPMPKQLC